MVLCSFNDIGNYLSRYSATGESAQYRVDLPPDEILVREGIFGRDGELFIFTRKGLESFIAHKFGCAERVHAGNVCCFGTVYGRELHYSAAPKPNFFNMHGPESSIIIGSNDADVPSGWKGHAALVSIPLVCLWKRPSVRDKVAVYRDNATAAHRLKSPPPATSPQSPIGELLKDAFASVRMQWMPFIATNAMLIAGIVWTLCLRHPLAILAAIPAAIFGYVGQMMVACPKFIPQDEIAKRRLDVDLVRDFLKFRTVITLHALVVSSVVVVWLGGRDAALLAALSLLAAGSINITNSVSESEDSEKVDWLFAPVYLLAYAAVCALRVAGFHWFVCLLPLPFFAFLVPAIRWFFPRSGLRGAERRAAIADMPSRLKADIRSDAEKSRDEKAATRRRRDARRIANLRRSRGDS